MDKTELFFVIEVISKDHSRGFIVEKPDGIHVSDQPIADMARFNSYYEAREFIKKHKLQRGGVKTTILSNQQLISSAGDYKTFSKAPVIYYLVVNGKGQKAFFNTKLDGYYFDDAEVGYCVWRDEDAVKEFIKQMGFPEDVTHKRIVQDLTTTQKN